MSKKNKYLLALIFALSGFILMAQNEKFNESKENEILVIRGSVYMQKTREPIEQVSIEVNNGTYTRTNKEGKFTIKAKIGDELTVSHNNFETVFYTITSGERIVIEVTSNDKTSSYRSRVDAVTLRFNQMIDSADVYLKQDAEKSIKFVGDALSAKISSSQSAEAHELLGDIYMYWKQYDLAISAFKISLQNEDTSSAKLKLANAYNKNEEFQKSLATYNEIKEKNLSNYQKTTFYEGIGDVYLNLDNFNNAIISYEDGLKIAQRHLITPKITDFNSKIAQAYITKGESVKAKDYFSNSLSLASKENKKRAVEEKIKVAEFNSAIQDYESEISLRKEIIEDIKDIEKDSVIANESPITSQKQNYKIASALILQNRNADAIPYLEESITEAREKEDLVVQKDATRTLSEALIRSGETEQGLAMVDNYKAIVDELYAKKEQELSRVARFSRNIAEQQNRITSLESDRLLSQSKYQLTQERNKRQQLIIYSLIGGLVLLLVTGYFMFKYIKQQRLANNLLALKSLRSQMNPHFIFNALNSVNSFIATNDERTANKYLSDFSYLMRSVLENSEEDFIPLKKEIELLELYTKLEHFRFQDKFDYTINIDERIDIEEFKIPPMLLQPYIENAVWHGLRYKSGKGKLTITMEPKSRSELAITIADNGIGRERSKASKTQNQKKQRSKGMNNIKKRVEILNEMYKDKVDVVIEDLHHGEDPGTKVVVTLKKD